MVPEKAEKIIKSGLVLYSGKRHVDVPSKNIKLLKINK